MSKEIGAREKALREMREAQFKPVGFAKAVKAATLPKTSGNKPVKRKRGKR